MDGLVITISEWCWWPCSNSILVLWTWELTLMLFVSLILVAIVAICQKLELPPLWTPLQPHWKHCCPPWQPPGPLIISGGSPLCHPDHCGPASSYRRDQPQARHGIEAVDCWCILRQDLNFRNFNKSLNASSHRWDQPKARHGTQTVDCVLKQDLNFRLQKKMFTKPPVIAEINLNRLAMGLRPQAMCVL